MRFKSGDKIIHKTLGYCIFQYYGMSDNEAIVETEGNKIMVVSVSSIRKVLEEKK